MQRPHTGERRTHRIYLLNSSSAKQRVKFSFCGAMCESLINVLFTFNLDFKDGYVEVDDFRDNN